MDKTLFDKYLAVRNRLARAVNAADRELVHDGRTSGLFRDHVIKSKLEEDKNNEPKTVGFSRHP